MHPSDKLVENVPASSKTVSLVSNKHNYTPISVMQGEEVAHWQQLQAIRFLFNLLYKEWAYSLYIELAVYSAH